LKYINLRKLDKSDAIAGRDPVQVGDFCQIGNELGTVEDIGLRSLKLSGLDGNLVIVPNRVLAQSQFKNMMHRKKLLLNTTFSLRIETRAEQLRLVLNRDPEVSPMRAFDDTTSLDGKSPLPGFYVTFYLFGYGADETEARKRWAKGLRQVTALLAATAA
jgi:hypothetical protein